MPGAAGSVRPARWSRTEIWSRSKSSSAGHRFSRAGHSSVVKPITLGPASPATTPTATANEPPPAARPHLPTYARTDRAPRATSTGPPPESYSPPRHACANCASAARDSRRGTRRGAILEFASCGSSVAGSSVCRNPILSEMVDLARVLTVELSTAVTTKQVTQRGPERTRISPIPYISTIGDRCRPHRISCPVLTGAEVDSKHWRGARIISRSGGHAPVNEAAYRPQCA